VKRLIRMVLLTIFALSLMAALFTGLISYVIWKEHPELPVFRQFTAACAVSLAVAAGAFAIERAFDNRPKNRAPKQIDIDLARRVFPTDNLAEHQARIGHIRHLRIVCSDILAVGMSAQQHMSALSPDGEPPAEAQRQ